jgi:hypothetical protein
MGQKALPGITARTVAQNKKILGTGIEPVTYCVLSSRHNQLDHPSLIILIDINLTPFRLSEQSIA